jgi:subtilisin family serine protease
MIDRLIAELKASLLVMALTGVALLNGCTAGRIMTMAQMSSQRLADDPDRYIIAGVDNDEGMPAGHAGSSPKGYDGLRLYGPTARALERLHGIERDYGLHEISAWPIMPLHMHCAVLEVSVGTDRGALLAALAGDQRVRIVEPVQAFSTQSTVYDDPYVGLQRGFQRLNVAEAHAWSRGEGVRIAIIDTGADTGHPDLKGVVVQVGNFVDHNDRQFKRDRHGTELAGIIAAVANNHQGIVGVAPGARLAVFKACWQLGDDADAARCNSFTLAQALTAALDARVQIVNLSLAGPADPLLRELIGEGLRRGIVFVGAAADGADTRRNLLAIDGMIAVANGGTQGPAGTPLHAPGSEILTLLPGGRYDFASGTSLSTAHVTGTAALLLGKNPRLSSPAVYQLLRATTTSGDEAGGGDSVDACAAVTVLVGHGSCVLSQSAGRRVAMH